MDRIIEFLLIETENIRESVMLWIQIMGVAAIVMALFWTVKTLRLQRVTFSLGLFGMVANRIQAVQDQEIDCERKNEVLEWYMGLFDAFEYFAFYANRNYFAKDVAGYYRSSIIEYVDDAKKHEDVVTYIKERPAAQLSELRTYYKTVTGNDFPY